MIAAPAERAKKQTKADISLRVKTAVTTGLNPDGGARGVADDDDFGSLLEIRMRIEGLLEEQQVRASENETNLIELRLIHGNLNAQFSGEPSDVELSEVTKYMSQVQEVQERLQESIAFLVKGPRSFSSRRTGSRSTACASRSAASCS